MQSPPVAAPTNIPTPTRWGVRLGIFLAAFFFYMLTTSRERPWADGTPVWEVAESIVADGTFAIHTRWPPNAPTGVGGKSYAYNPLLNSLVHVPGAALRARIAKKWPDALPLSWPLACHLAPSAIGALVCVLFFGLCREHGASGPIAALSTIAVGACSCAWVYAHYPYSEILQMAFFTGAVLQLVRVIRTPIAREAAWLGLWAGLLFSAKSVYAVALPLPAAYLVWTLRRDRRALARVLLTTAVFLLPAPLLYFYYNWARWGSPTDPGYVLGPALRQGNLLVGLWGMFLSPGKSLFLYSPPVLLALFGARDLIRQHRHTAIVMALSIAPVLALNARLPFWHGDYAWGPRYTVFAVPVLILPLCLVLQRLAAALPDWRRLARKAAVIGVLGAGLFVQILGNAFHWDHWIRITIDARAAWLGALNRGGAFPPDRGGICDSCFEDMHQLHWLPQFQPIRGHLWLGRHVLMQHKWVQAEKDAPWHPDTSLQLNIADKYARARLDWWILDYGEDPIRTKAAVIIVVVMVVGLGTGLFLALRRPRPRIIPPPLAVAGPPPEIPPANLPGAEPPAPPPVVPDTPT